MKIGVRDDNFASTRPDETVARYRKKKRSLTSVRIFLIFANFGIFRKNELIPMFERASKLCIAFIYVYGNFNVTNLL